MLHTISRLALVAAFSIGGIAHAQKAAETSNVPQRAGEASTMTGGAPNAKTTNETTTPSTADKASSKPSKVAKTSKASKTSTGKGSATETSNSPQRAGEASTMTGGVPNKKTTN